MALLKVFNPHELSASVVLSVATGREKPLEQILSVVRDNLRAPVKQHIIVSAPRGYGKSFFLRYIEVKIAEIAEAEGLPIVMALLSEELPHVKEPDTLIAEIKRTFLNEPPETVGVRWAEDDGGAWDEAITQLDSAIEERFHGESGLLIVGVENFDLLVKKAFGKPLQSGRLREFLSRPGNRVMLLAASARGAFDRNYDLPLFKAFEQISLEPWTINQTIEFLVAQRRATAKPSLTTAQLAKASAVATFISGTPRLATLIGEALLEGDPLGAADLLEKIVDELTPYYKERIEVLPTRSQALLDALLRGGERCSATELANRVGAPSQSAIAAPLDDLKKDLVVVGDKSPDSAEILLRVADRVFAHYYRKRILNHGRESCPLEALVDILALIYSPEEQRREAEKFAARGLAQEAAIMTRLWQAGRESGSQGVVARKGEAPSSEFDKLIADWDSVTNQSLYKEGLSILDKALTLARQAGDVTQEAVALTDISWTQDALGQHEEALVTAKDASAKAVIAGNLREQAIALRHASWSLGMLGRYEDAQIFARDAYDKAVNAEDIDEQAISLRYAAWFLNKLDRNEEALAMAHDAYDKAVTAGDMHEQAQALRHVALILGDLGRHKEALTSARKAYSKAKRARDIRLQAMIQRHISWNLAQLDRHKDALTMARAAHVNALEAGALDEQALALSQVAYNLNCLEKHADALEAAYDAAAKAAQFGDRAMSAFVAGGMLSLRPSDAKVALGSYQELLHDAASNKSERIGLYFDDIANVVTSEREWPALIALLEAVPEIADRLTENTYAIGEPGRFLSQAMASRNRVAAAECGSHFVSALAQAIEGCSDSRLIRLWRALLNASAEAVASQVSEVHALRDFCEILTAHPSVPTRSVSLISASANYHESGRDPNTLVRLDPDLATLLVTVFPLLPNSTRKAKSEASKKKR